MSKKDELLGIAVRKYAALYDKTVPEFKDKTKVNVIWGKVAKELSISSGKLFLFMYTI